MINNALSDYSDMSDDFEFEKDEDEVTIRPYEVDYLPNDYFAMNYRMEIVEDKDGAVLWFHFRSFRDVLPVEKQ